MEQRAKKREKIRMKLRAYVNYLKTENSKLTAKELTTNIQYSKLQLKDSSNFEKEVEEVGQ